MTVKDTCKNDLKDTALATSHSEDQAGMNMQSGSRAHGSALRWSLSLPFAGFVTAGLAVVMAGLIAVEFVPQDKLEAIQADINPVVQDIAELIPLAPPEMLQAVKVPPPPPVIGTPKTEEVYVPPVLTKVVTIKFDPKDLTITRSSNINLDVEYQPLVRIPPIMPSRAERSGHCKVRFDVSPQGQPFNVEAVFCSQQLFARNTVKSVQQWKYHPKVRDGQAITVSGVENIVRFNLTDERGDIIPE